MMDCNNMFIVDQFCDCSIRITDNTHCIYGKNYFDYKDTITLDIVVYNRYNDPQLFAVIFTDHQRGYLNEVKLPIGFDGFYTIYHIILPTYQWYICNKNKRYNNFKKYKDIYISDHNKIYKVVNGELQEFDVLNFISNINLDKTTVQKFSKDIFLICNLKKCYISICNNWINQLENKDQLKQLEFRRDFIWSTIEVLQILISKCQYEKAEQIMEEIMSCGGICSNILYNKQKPQYTQYFTESSTGIYLEGNCNCNN